MAASKRHGGAPAAGLGGQRHAHATRGAVADVAHRVERLARAPGAHDDVPPRQGAAGREQPLGPRDDLLRLRHPPRPDLALRKLSVSRADDVSTSRDERLEVRLRRRMEPHRRVHCGRDENRPPVRERRLRENVVGDAVRQPRHRVGGEWSDEEKVGSLQMGVRVCERLLAREREQRLCGHEALGPCGR